MIVTELFASLGIKWDKGAEAKARDDMGRFVKGADKKLNGFATGAMKMLAGVATATAAVFQGLDALKFTEQLGRLNNSAKGSLGTLDELSSKVLEISSRFGIAKEQVAAGTARFIELTGKPKIAAENMALFAEVAQATGSTMDEVAGAAAGVSESLDIDSGEFRQMFDVLIAGGQEGAAELRDTAVVMAELAAESAKFKDSAGIGGVERLGAALQMATGLKGGNASQGATAMRRMLGFFGSDTFNRKVADVTGRKDVAFDQDGKLKSWVAIVKELESMDLSDKDIGRIFTNKEAAAGFNALTRTKGAWDDLTEATSKSNITAKNYAKISQNDAIKITKAWIKFKNTLTKGFLVVVKVFGKLSEHMDLVSVAIISLAGAYAILNASAAAAGWATFWAGLKATASWLLLGAIIAALALLFVDFVETLQGKDTVLRRFWEKITGSWKEDLYQFFLWMEREFNRLANRVGGKIADTFSFLPGVTSTAQHRRNLKLTEMVGAVQRVAPTIQLDAARTRLIDSARYNFGESPDSSRNQAASGHNLTFNIVEAGNAHDTAEAVRDVVVNDLKAGTAE